MQTSSSRSYNVVRYILFGFINRFFSLLMTFIVRFVLRNLILTRLVKQLYPQYVCRGSIGNTQFAELKQLVYGMMLSKIRGTSRHAIDNIFITAFISLTMQSLNQEVKICQCNKVINMHF